MSAYQVDIAAAFGESPYSIRRIGTLLEYRGVFGGAGIVWAIARKIEYDLNRG
jgi:hypothetical protein